MSFILCSPSATAKINCIFPTHSRSEACSPAAKGYISFFVVLCWFFVIFRRNHQAKQRTMTGVPAAKIQVDIRKAVSHCPRLCKGNDRLKAPSGGRRCPGDGRHGEHGGTPHRYPRIRSSWPRRTRRCSHSGYHRSPA